MASSSTPGWRRRRGIAPPSVGPSCLCRNSTPAPGTCWQTWTLSSVGRRRVVVQAGQRLVRDVGTQFDVRQRPDGLTVTVARGRVEVGGASAGKGVLLGPGQRLTLDNDGVGQLSAVDPAETFAWRAGRL